MKFIGNEDTEPIEYGDLRRKKYAPLSWRLDGLIPETGLVFWGGRKKAGKSYQVLQLMTHIGAGLSVWGREPTACRVVYLALEDGRRRLNARLSEQKAPPDADVRFLFKLRTLDSADGLREFDELLHAEKPGIILIDNLAHLKTGRVRENDNDAFVDIVHFLQAEALKHKLAIVIVAHHRKGAPGGDPGDDIRGAGGVAASADLNVGLYHERGKWVLRGESRLSDGFELRLEREPATKTWKFLGDHHSLELDETYQTVKRAFRSEEFDVAGAAAVLDVSVPTARRQLEELAGNGWLKSDWQKRGGARAQVFQVKRLPELKLVREATDSEER